MSKVMELTESVFGVGSSPRWPSFYFNIIRWEGQGNFLGHFYKGTNPIYEGSLSPRINYLPKTLPPNPINLGRG